MFIDGRRDALWAGRKSRILVLDVTIVAQYVWMDASATSARVNGLARLVGRKCDPRVQARVERVEIGSTAVRGGRALGDSSDRVGSRS
jgi:hypothetical protein